MNRIAKHSSRTAHSRSISSFVRFRAYTFIGLSLVALNVVHGQTATYVLGATNYLVGPTAGSNSVVLGVAPQTGTWTATANTNWLHVSPADENGTGSTNVIFSHDANSGATRYGTVTIGNQTLAVTQAGSAYLAASGPTMTLVSSGLNGPNGIALDAAGNIYIADTYDNAIKKWTASNDTLTTLVSEGLNQPEDVALDSAGNVYIADTDNNAVRKWSAADNTLTTVDSSGFGSPWELAVDGTGNIYITDANDNDVYEWFAAGQTLHTLFSSGAGRPGGVAVDNVGNVYTADGSTNAIYEWTASDGNQIALITNGLIYPFEIAVDGFGNLYIAEWSDNPVQKWTASDNSLTTLYSSGIGNATGVAVDSVGNAYIANWNIYEIPLAFMVSTPKFYDSSGGDGELPPVLLSTTNQLIESDVSSDEPWLHLGGVSNNVVSFSVPTNSGPNRRANITLLGQSIQIFQASPLNFLNPTMPSNGVFQFAFSNFANSSFTVLSTGNLLLPMSNWTAIGPASNIGPNLFEFTDTNPPTDSQRFYRVRSP
jgi:sugar lactone lactonase YvrE